MVFDGKREKQAYGSSWAQQAEGYFSAPEMARDYIAAIMHVVSDATPTSIVDLGGGTGFIFEQLIEAGIPENIRLVVIDDSQEQLSQCLHSRIMPLKGGFQSFSRSEVVDESGKLMVISRSVLQYAGFDGQKLWLDHLRGQMLVGEWFVHQSGCTEDLFFSRELNRLFAAMNVDKWVPNYEAFEKLLHNARFEIIESFTVHSVGMASEELIVRYGVSHDNIEKIKVALSSSCVHRPDIVVFPPTGFIFNFPYRVFLCRTV
jgi:hypothetical protein